MRIELHQISRSFGTQNIFKGVDLIIEEGSSLAVLGGNGSGKSTLLKLIYGALTPSSGHISCFIDGKPVSKEKSPFAFSMASPYFELIEELKAGEFLHFCQKFKPLLLTPEDILKIAYLDNAGDKEIRYFSSGMKQRLRLALAVFSNVSAILLDEPVSNLDPAGVEWYGRLLKDYRKGRTLIVGSNFSEQEIALCEKKFFLENYKNEKV